MVSGFGNRLSILWRKTKIAVTKTGRGAKEVFLGGAGQITNQKYLKKIVNISRNAYDKGLREKVQSIFSKFANGSRKAINSKLARNIIGFSDKSKNRVSRAFNKIKRNSGIMSSSVGMDWMINHLDFDKIINSLIGTTSGGADESRNITSADDQSLLATNGMYDENTVKNQNKKINDIKKDVYSTKEKIIDLRNRERNIVYESSSENEDGYIPKVEENNEVRDQSSKWKEVIELLKERNELESLSSEEEFYSSEYNNKKQKSQRDLVRAERGGLSWKRTTKKVGIGAAIAGALDYTIEKIDSLTQAYEDYLDATNNNLFLDNRFHFRPTSASDWLTDLNYLREHIFKSVSPYQRMSENFNKSFALNPFTWGNGNSFKHSTIRLAQGVSDFYLPALVLKQVFKKTVFDQSGKNKSFIIDTESNIVEKAMDNTVRNDYTDWIRDFRSFYEYGYKLMPPEAESNIERRNKIIAEENELKKYAAKNFYNVDEDETQIMRRLYYSPFLSRDRKFYEDAIKGSGYESNCVEYLGPIARALADMDNYMVYVSANLDIAKRSKEEKLKANEIRIKINKDYAERYLEETRGNVTKYDFSSAGGKLRQESRDYSTLIGEISNLTNGNRLFETINPNSKEDRVLIERFNNCRRVKERDKELNIKGTSLKERAEEGLTYYEIYTFLLEDKLDDWKEYYDPMMEKRKYGNKEEITSELEEKNLKVLKESIEDGMENIGKNVSKRAKHKVNVLMKENEEEVEGLETCRKVLFDDKSIRHNLIFNNNSVGNKVITAPYKVLSVTGEKVSEVREAIEKKAKFSLVEEDVSSGIFPLVEIVGEDVTDVNGNEINIKTVNIRKE